MSESRPKFSLDAVRVVAKEIYDRLLPFCERCKVVGSVRLCRPLVSDIELLFIPKLATRQAWLFGHDVEMVDLADKFLCQLERDGYLKKRPNINGSTCWGAQNKLAIHTASAMPIDFFATTAENWPVALVIRTGGKRTNLQLTMGANKRGLTLNAYGSGFTRLKDGTKIHCDSEESVFKHAGVPYLDPRERQ